MRLLRKPERWMCLPTSFAMVLDLPLSAIFDEIGHDGSPITWPDLPEPLRRRGFHPQELVHVCLSHGHAATLVELYPVLRTTPDGSDYIIAYPDDNWARFTRIIGHSRGVIEGVNHRRCGHAVAYEYGRIFDPEGCEYDYSPAACQQCDFFPQNLWRIDRIGGCA
jgi:hypothetical protein